jgi:hypothetical protein
MKKAKLTKREKLVKLLLKRGNNDESVKAMVDENYEYLIKTYPDSTPSKLAEIIICL